MNRTIEAMKQVQPTWNDDEFGHLFVGAQQRVKQRRTRRKLAQATFATTGAVMLMVCGTWLLRKPTEQASQPTAVVVQATSGDQLLRFPDGSSVQLLSLNTTITPREVSATQTHLELVTGAAHFEVRSQPTIHFRVDVGTVAVEVLGTKFDLERDKARTMVRVQEGVVWVTWPGGVAEVQAGQSGWFPPVTGVPTGAAHDNSVAPKDAPAAPSPRTDWRRLARRQDFGAALSVLERERVQVSDEPGDLLLAADSARLGGKPAKAVPYLQSVVRRHPSDARAPAAAFTLGRLLLDTLDAPHKAAVSFEQAQRLAPQGPLAEDALFRQTEAWLRAGDSRRAKQSAAEYQRVFPKGRKLSALRTLMAGTP